jgi:hypothetical protein
MQRKALFGTDFSDLSTILLFPGFHNYVCVSMLFRVRFVRAIEWSCVVLGIIRVQKANRVSRGRRGVYRGTKESSITVARK